jgi:uncharacterized protein (TIGR03663 family)
MTGNLFRWLSLALVTAVAFWLRVADLDRRPMHADEANQALKLGDLLEKGHYAFDPNDHHGPTLYYAAVPIAWLRGERTLAALDETTIRLVPVLFGTAAVLLLGLLASPLGRWPALAAAAFLAVSPPAVYYSRYFIQETLLLTFFLGACVCAQQWWLRGKIAWAIAAGACIGFMQATKATTPLFLIAAVIALLLARIWGRGASWPEPVERPTAWLENSAARPWSTLLSVLAAALFTAALLYSSFFTHLAGLRDALATYSHAVTRFGAGAPSTGHEKPWWFYLRLFGWIRQGVVWQQLGFSALAAAGLAVAFFTRDRFLRGVAIYTLIIVAAFSAFALKNYSPWQSIHFVPGFALLAAGSLAAMARLLTGKFVAVPLALLVGISQFTQTKLSSYVRPADARNPYAYVHSVPDVLKYRPLVEAALARSPDKPVHVVVEDRGYWPLPWYFRGLPRVAYWETPPTECDGALVIVSASQADSVRARLHGAYQESFLGLRPGFVCIVFTPTEGNEGVRK